LTYLEKRLQLKLNGKQEPEKKRYVIKHFSAKRASQQKEYAKIVREMMSELKVVGVCTGKSSGLHHQKKRIGFLLDNRYLKRACTSCNNWAENFPLEAIKLGISLSKF
jgi:hypothetical protein